MSCSANPFLLGFAFLVLETASPSTKKDQRSSVDLVTAALRKLILVILVNKPKASLNKQFEIKVLDITYFRLNSVGTHLSCTIFRCI